MVMQPVVSTNLVAVGYDSVRQILRIQFKNGTYEYYDVPTKIYEGLMNASSKGHYHQIHIKDSFRYIKLNQ